MTNRNKFPPNCSEIKPCKQWNTLLKTLPKNQLGRKILRQWGKRAWIILERWLAKHAYLQERHTFEKGYRLALWYLTFQNQLQEKKIIGYSSMQLDRATGISYGTIKGWIEGDHTPLLIRSLEAHDAALKRHLTKFSLEVHQHRVNPVIIYYAFQHFDRRRIQANELIQCIIQLLQERGSEKVLFLELFPYNQYGPQWLRKISAEIKNHISTIERVINDLVLNRREKTKIHMGMINDTLYIWLRNTDPDLWLNIDKDELYYFKTPEAKARLINETKRHLGLRSDRSLSRLIIQLIKHCQLPTDNSNIVDIKRKRSRLYIRGGILQFLLDTTNQHIREIAPTLHRIGGMKGQGGIQNPLFPPIDPLRTRLLATMLCDGHLTKDGSLHYFEKNQSRTTTVEKYIKQMGDVYIWKGKHADDINWLQISNVVGRRLKTWGMPEGDKAIQQVNLPEYLFTAPPEIRRAYLEELIPEDGAFSVRKTGLKSGRFKWDRMFALISPKRKVNMKNWLLDQSLEIEEFVYDFMSRFGTPKRKNIQGISSLNYFELNWGTLQKLTKSKYKGNSQKALQFRNIIEQSHCKLIEDESRLAESLGIKVRTVITRILLHTKSRRVSINWRNETVDNINTIRFGLLAPPRHEKKLSAFKEWIKSRPHEEIREIIEALERDEMKPRIQV